MTAKEQYQQAREEINSLIQQLNELLDAKDRKVRNDTENWGHAGDIGHVKEILTNMVNFLK